MLTDGQPDGRPKNIMHPPRIVSEGIRTTERRKNQQTANNRNKTRLWSDSLGASPKHRQSQYFNTGAELFTIMLQHFVLSNTDIDRHVLLHGNFRQRGTE